MQVVCKESGNGLESLKTVMDSSEQDQYCSKHTQGDADRKSVRSGSERKVRSARSRAVSGKWKDLYMLLLSTRSVWLPYRKGWTLAKVQSRVRRATVNTPMLRHIFSAEQESA